MKMMTSITQENKLEGGPMHMMRGNNHIYRPMPPHERKTLLRINFDENDWSLFQIIYGDDDEAAAAMQVLMDAPPEIQIIAVQLISLIEEVENEH